MDFKRNISFLIILMIMLVLTANISEARAPEFMGGEAERVLSLDHVRIIPFSESGITEFNESPMLQERVEEGELPPIAERLPDNPMVVEPEEEIGKYGGTITFTQFGPEGLGVNGHVLTEPPLLFNRDLNNIETIPNFAKDWEFSNDGHTFTLWLREGVRWSDGEELTTDDIMFWYEDILLNEELTAVVPSAYRPRGEVMEVKALDDYTVEFNFAAPYYMFHYQMNSYTYNGLEFFVPAHYLKQFHIDYNEDAQELAQEEGFDDWVQYFENRNSWDFWNPVPVGRPVLTAWMPVQVTPTGRIYERNPYYFKVDSEGNQLPYIDEQRTIYTPDAETRLMNVLAGEIDYISSFLSFADYPTIVANEDDGGYDAWIGESLWASRVTARIQQQPVDEEDMWDILGDERFRKALSVALDREEIKELVFMGQGQARQIAYHPGTVDVFKQEWAEAYAEYDPDRAREFLDDMGVVDQNGDGWRQKPDGENLLIRLLANSSRGISVTSAEMMKGFWEDVGIQVTMDTVEEGLFWSRLMEGETHVAVAPMAGDLPPIGPYSPGEPYYYSYANWLIDYDYFEEELMVDEIPEARADIAIEPPQHIKDWYRWAHMIHHVPPEERNELLTKIGDKLASELPSDIGIVGMAGHVGVSNKNLRNVRRVGDNPSIAATRNAYLEQSYFENPEDN